MINARGTYSELVAADDSAYKHWGYTFAKKRRRSSVAETSVDPTPQKLSREIGAEYQSWESALRKILSLHSTEYPNRILKYKNKNGVLAYREIDYIANIADALLLCEIKLRNHIDILSGTRSIYKKGWKQVRASQGIAKHNYSLLRPLLIVVDMSYVFDIDYLPSEQRPDFFHLAELNSYFGNLKTLISEDHFHKGAAINLLLLDSKEVFDVAKEKGILSCIDMNRFRTLIQQKSGEERRENISFSTQNDESINNPFSILKELI